MSFLNVITAIFMVVCVTKENNLETSMVNFKNKLADFFYINKYAADVISFSQKFELERLKLKKLFRKYIKKAFDSFENKTKKITKLRKSEVEWLSQDEKNMTATQLIAFHGYQLETHHVHTRDGYVLDIHRILSISPKSVKGKERLALLHHGLMGSSEDWLMLGPGRALPYLFSDAGYDVWLTNARGNKYSGFDHADFKLSAFWDFSFHEMGYFDLSAVIDYIQSRNKNELEINFVGHSMGGTALLVLLSTLTKYNQVLNSATLLAPLAFMFQIKGPLKLLAEFYKKNGRDSLNFLGENEFIAEENFPRQFIEKFCVSAQKVCINPLLFLADGGIIDLEANILENILSRIPAGTSTKTILHYLQLINSGQFQYFDYGASDNLKKHGDVTAPTYDLRKVTLPILLFSSRHDWLCTMPNMQTLLHNLPNVVVHHIVRKLDFSHTDFVWGENATRLVFHPLLDILQKCDFSKAKRNCTSQS